MRMAVDNPVQVGEFVHIQLVLSRTPVMHIDVYGQVVRVDAPFGGCGGFYYLGIKFRIWMSIPGKIIGSIFKRQRRTLRKRVEDDSLSPDCED